MDWQRWDGLQEGLSLQIDEILFHFVFICSYIEFFKPDYFLPLLCEAFKPLILL